MKSLGNILWHFPFFGFMFSLFYALWGIFCCITIIFIPVGKGYLQFSGFLLSPFKNEMVSKSDLVYLGRKKSGSFASGYNLLLKILYFPFGLLNSISVIVVIAAEFISIIGIPVALVWAKSLGTIFCPIGKVRVSSEEAEIIRAKKVEELANRMVAEEGGEVLTESALKLRANLSKYSYVVIGAHILALLLYISNLYIPSFTIDTTLAGIISLAPGITILGWFIRLKGCYPNDKNMIKYIVLATLGILVLPLMTLPFISIIRSYNITALQKRALISFIITTWLNFAIFCLALLSIATSGVIEVDPTLELAGLLLSIANTVSIGAFMYIFSNNCALKREEEEEE